MKRTEYKQETCLTCHKEYYTALFVSCPHCAMKAVKAAIVEDLLRQATSN